MRRPLSAEAERAPPPSTTALGRGREDYNSHKAVQHSVTLFLRREARGVRRELWSAAVPACPAPPPPLPPWLRCSAPAASSASPAPPCRCPPPAAMPIPPAAPLPWLSPSPHPHR